MFSVPLGIMFGADVSQTPSPRPKNISRSVLTHYVVPQLTTAEYIRKSLIAAYLGNIVGALFVGLPAVYIHLSGYRYADIDADLHSLESGSGSNATKAETIREHEVYRVPTPKNDSD